MAEVEEQPATSLDLLLLPLAELVVSGGDVLLLPMLPHAIFHASDGLEQTA